MASARWKKTSSWILITGIMSTGIFLSASAIGQPAGTGSIRGRVNEPGMDDISEQLLRDRSLLRYETHLPPLHETVPPYKLSEKSVVYIESAPPGSWKQDSSLQHPQLNQSRMLFHPLVLPVLAGATVDFPNNDDVFHNVFSYSQTREFDLGRYPRGQKKSVLFEKPGVVKVYCDIHSYMYAVILVLENPFFTVPDDDGSYTISGIPAGTYKLSLWYGRKKTITRTVTVEEGKVSVINFDQ